MWRFASSFEAIPKDSDLMAAVIYHMAHMPVASLGRAWLERGCARLPFLGSRFTTWR